MKHKILWITCLCLLGVICYLCFALLPYNRQPAVSENTIQSCTELSFYSDTPSSDRAVILSDNEEALAERIRLIDSAKEHIVLCTFDFQADNSGKAILSALCHAAARGVQVDILTDGFSYFLHTMRNPYFIALGSMETAVIKVYNPVNFLHPEKLMARMHDKYLLVDDTAYILGGRNTFDYFLGNDTDYRNYDWDVLVYHENPSADSSLYQLAAYFESVWTLPDCKTVMDSYSSHKSSEIEECRQELSSLYETLHDTHPEYFSPVDYSEITAAVNHIELLSNPVTAAVKEPVLFYQMTELMKQSKEPIFFHTPYILCNEAMQHRLAAICEDNPNVCMMTNSVANNGNPFGATDYLLHKTDILATGINILEYDAGISYHGKCFTIGNRLSGIGSFNWDMRSAYIDTELMLVIDSPALNTQLRQEMERYESAALAVQDAVSYNLQPGQSPQEISSGKKRRISLLKPLDSWFRFLM